MGQLLDLQEARRRLGLALEVLSHDRWVVGLLRGGALQPVAASEISRRLLQARPLQPLSRRALFEQRPVVVNSVFPYTTPAAGFDWELDWPAIMYAPIGQPGERPIGLLRPGDQSRSGRDGCADELGEAKAEPANAAPDTGMRV